MDLGGIGKGFALDEMSILLGEWNVDNVLLAAGASSMLAVGPAQWPIELAAGDHRMSFPLSDGALSASGVDMQGSHFLHPGGKEKMVSTLPQRVWVTAPDAASAEIWSTALMMVPDDQLGNGWRRVATSTKCSWSDTEGSNRSLPATNPEFSRDMKSLPEGPTLSELAPIGTSAQGLTKISPAGTYRSGLRPDAFLTREECRPRTGPVDGHCGYIADFPNGFERGPLTRGVYSDMLRYRQTGFTLVLRYLSCIETFSFPCFPTKITSLNCLSKLVWWTDSKWTKPDPHCPEPRPSSSTWFPRHL